MTIGVGQQRVFRYLVCPEYRHTSNFRCLILLCQHCSFCNVALSDNCSFTIPMLKCSIQQRTVRVARRAASSAARAEMRIQRPQAHPGKGDKGDAIEHRDVGGRIAGILAVNVNRVVSGITDEAVDGKARKAWPRMTGAHRDSGSITQRMRRAKTKSSCDSKTTVSIRQFRGTWTNGASVGSEAGAARDGATGGSAAVNARAPRDRRNPVR